MASASSARKPHARVRGGRARFALAAAAALAAFAFGACGGDDEPDVEPLPTQFIPAPVPTIADAAGVPLTPATGAIPGYTISIPSDWIPDPPQVGGEDIYNLKEGERILAQVSVLCERPLVREGRPLEAIEYANNDITYVRELRGTNDAPETFLVGSVPAASLRYVTTLGPVSVRQKVVHFIIEECHWTLRMRVYAPGDVTSYEVLFDRMVQSFTTT
jgi:hypothetical protein